MQAVLVLPPDAPRPVHRGPPRASPTLALLSPTGPPWTALRLADARAGLSNRATVECSASLPLTVPPWTALRRADTRALLSPTGPPWTDPRLADARAGLSDRATVARCPRSFVHRGQSPALADAVDGSTSGSLKLNGGPPHPSDLRHGQNGVLRARLADARAAPDLCPPWTSPRLEQAPAPSLRSTRSKKISS